MRKIIHFVPLCVLLACSACVTGNSSETEPAVNRLDTLGLVVLSPEYSSVGLVCGTRPSMDADSVLLFAAASFTGECLKEFKHSNVAGDHVSDGRREKGFACRRNTGAFVYFNGTWKFCPQPYSAMLDTAAVHGGCAFGQELIVCRGKLCETIRKDANVNQFRALCGLHGRLCVVESAGKLSFGGFKRKLLELGVSDAIYLDMGPGWNHACYRDGDSIVVLHPYRNASAYCTNWIVFYK